MQETLLSFWIFHGFENPVGFGIMFKEGIRNKAADFKVGQNSRFWKRDKIADFDNETKPPILKWDKTADL